MPNPPVHFRMPPEDLAKIEKAIAKSGIPATHWWRLVGLAAAGDTTVVKQIEAASAAGRAALGRKK